MSRQWKEINHVFPFILMVLLGICPPLAIAGTSAVKTDTSQVEVGDFLSYTHRENLVGSAAGTVAWVDKRLGVRNVWIWDQDEKKSRAITYFTKDDGQQIYGLNISEDGKDVVFVRGGDGYSSDQTSNPESLIKSPKQQIWRSHSLKTAEVVVEGNNPVISPDGNMMLFVRGGQWFSLDLKNSKSKPEALFHVRGNIKSLRFSPSGDNVVFVSDRGSHALVGVYTFGGNAIRWMAPGLSRDSHPIWSPDGKQIAYLRYPGRRYNVNELFFRTYPFEIYTVNVKTGRGHMVWTSPKDSGGYAHEIGTPLAWLGNEQLVFQSEHEGWLQAYAINAAGGTVVSLMPKACELTQSFIDRGSLVFASNCGDVNRRHIWRSDIKSGQYEQLTFGNGVEIYPVSAGGGDIVFLANGFDSPMSVSLLTRDNERSQLTAKENWPHSQSFIKPEEIIFVAEDGMKIHANIIIPKADKGPQEKRPSIIFFHGGPYRQMLPSWHELGYYSNAYAVSQFFALQGYVVLNVNYRSGVGYGHDFRMAKGQGPEGASEYQDMVGAAKYLGQRPDVDPARIGIWGGSHGGVMVAWGLARNSDLFAAGVDISGVHDWRQFALDQMGASQHVMESFDGEIMRKASPAADIDGWKSPVLFIGGDDDRSVYFEQTVDLADRVKAKGVMVEHLVFPDERHDFARHKTWLIIAQEMVDFFNRHLEKSKD